MEAMINIQTVAKVVKAFSRKSFPRLYVDVRKEGEANICTISDGHWCSRGEVTSDVAEGLRQVLASRSDAAIKSEMYDNFTKFLTSEPKAIESINPFGIGPAALKDMEKAYKAIGWEMPKVFYPHDQDCGTFKGQVKDQVTILMGCRPL